MIIIDVEKIKKLRNYLDDACYDTLNQKIRQHQNYFFSPLPNEYDNIQLELLKLKTDKRILLKLLLLGDKIALSEIGNVISSEFLKLLIELGIIIKSDGYVQTDSYIIVSFLDKYFLVGIPYNNPNCKVKDPAVYIGMDTYRLTENITSKRVNKVLDLCAGSGIQGICAANKANSVTLVEINHQTIPFIKFNILLNNVEDKVRIEEGSLYEPLGNETYDEIYTNPPFIAVPKGWNFPIAGNGGENGLDIINKIIDIVARRRAYYEGPGSEKSPTPYGRFIEVDGQIKEIDLIEKMRGKCSVFPDELRAPKMAVTADLFNFLNDMNNLTVDGNKLCPEEKKGILTIVSQKGNITLRQLAKELNVDEVDIKGYRIDKNQKAIFTEFKGYKKIKSILEKEGYSISLNDYEMLDRIIEILTNKKGIQERKDYLYHLEYRLSDSVVKCSCYMN